MGQNNIQVGTQTHDYIFFGESKLRISNVENVIKDFYEDKHRAGKFFSFRELGELIKIRRCPDYFCESFMYPEVSHYALPFFEEEDVIANYN